MFNVLFRFQNNDGFIVTTDQGADIAEWFRRFVIRLHSSWAGRWVLKFQERGFCKQEVHLKGSYTALAGALW